MSRENKNTEMEKSRSYTNNKLESIKTSRSQP